MSSLYDLATRRLRSLFPASTLVRQLNMKRISDDMATVSASTRCSKKACPFPSFRDSLCKGHFADTRAQYSVMPSVSGTGNHVAA